MAEPGGAAPQRRCGDTTVHLRRAVLVDGYDVTAAPTGEHEFGRSADFLVRRRGTAHSAWARWVGAPGLLRGRAWIVTLSCVHCAAHTERSCCDTASSTGSVISLVSSPGSSKP
jgi:hypothetical protein